MDEVRSHRQFLSAPLLKKRALSPGTLPPFLTMAAFRKAISGFTWPAMTRARRELWAEREERDEVRRVGGLSLPHSSLLSPTLPL